MTLTKPRRRRLSAELVGVIGALVAFVGFGSYYALLVPPFAPPDEQAHVSYAAALGHGELPRISTPDRTPARGSWLEAQLATAPDDRYREVWVANHPPLHHLLLAPLLRVADAVGDADLGLVFARYLNLVAAAGGLVATYLLGSEVAGGVRRVGVAAAAMTALLPHAHYMFARAQNDGLAFATVTLALWAGVRYLRRGHDQAGLALVGVTVAAAAATRAVGLLVGLAIVAVLIVAGTWSADPGTPDRGVRLRRSLARGAAALAPTALLVGWFYVRNVVLYGDVGASHYLLERFDRRPLAGGTVGQLHDPSLWRRLLSSIVGGTVTGHRSTHTASWVVVLLAVTVLVAGAGLVVVLLREPRRRAGIGLCLVVMFVVVLTTAQHVAGGGSPYPRYLFPALGATAALVAVGLDRVRPVLATTVPVLLLAGSSVWLVRRTADFFAVDVGRRPPGLDVHVGGHLARSGSLVLAALGMIVLFGALARVAFARSAHSGSTSVGPSAGASSEGAVTTATTSPEPTV